MGRARAVRARRAAVRRADELGLGDRAIRVHRVGQVSGGRRAARQRQELGTLSVGATAVLPRGVSGYFNYQYLFGKDSFNDSRFTLGLRVEF